MRTLTYIGGLLLLTIFQATIIHAQVLPRGVGAVYMGTRQYSSGTPYFDINGKPTTLSERFDMNYNGSFLRSGKAGTDLKKLYDNIRAFESVKGGQERTMADDLELGVQKATVDLQFDAKVLGFGYGLTDKWTLLLGIPIMRASIAADIDVSGNNNALAIKNRLGDAAFDELKAGLDEASRINRNTILSKINDEYKYKDISYWEYAGLGDLLIGGRTSWDFPKAKGPSYSLLLTTYLSLPTGPQYDPDALAQVPISRGFTALDITSDHKFKWERLTLGSELGGAFGLPQKTQRRVPVGSEVLITADRKVDVNWSPGPETWVSAYAGVGTPTYQATYKLGINEDHPDTFSGPIEGDYDLMGEEASSQEIYHQLIFTVSTVDSYNSNKFFMPFIINLTGHQSIGGRTTLGKRYVELTFMTFFKTPAAGRDSSKTGDGVAMNTRSRKTQR
jgi:hypothetical protein